MDAKVVFSVACSLPEKEFASLYHMMKQKLEAHNKIQRKKKFQPPLSDAEAIQYLLRNVFSKS
jgi:hypothetical protein